MKGQCMDVAEMPHAGLGQAAELVVSGSCISVRKWD
jgi:hypothetical protein